MQEDTVTKRKRRKHTIVEKIIYIFVLLPYLLILVRTIQSARLTFDDCTETAVGTVKELWQAEEGDGEYYPTFEMKVDSVAYTHRQIFASKKGDWKAGDQVEITYNPANPQRMFTHQEIDSHKKYTIRTLPAVIIVGLGVLGIGISVYR